MIPKLDSSGHYPYLSLQFIDTDDGVSVLEDLGIEPMGSKRKSWLTLQGSEEPQPWLFKYARENTGEHWAEKIASELASLIGIPAARTELAEIDGSVGILVESFIPYAWDKELKNPIRLGELIHGNEILAGCFEGYDKDKQWGHQEHSWDNIRTCLRLRLDNYEQAMEQFAGHLVLDALICNTDRHHENWGLLTIIDSDSDSDDIKLAPSYDHASSLGRELSDTKRQYYIDERRIPDYIRRARGAIFHVSEGRYGDNPLELVHRISFLYPSWFRPWIKRLNEITEDDIKDILMKLPGKVMSLTSIEFCHNFLNYTMNRLREINL